MPDTTEQFTQKRKKKQQSNLVEDFEDDVNVFS